MKQITLISLFLGFFFCANAQKSTGELPYSWERGDSKTMLQTIPMVTMPSLDMDAIREEDQKNESAFVAAPYRFGIEHDVNFSLSNSGIWETTSDGGRLWRLRIYSPDARSLHLLYDKFWLPRGAKYFIYSEDMTQRMGAFTYQNNNGDRENNPGYATGLLYTNSIILEYYEPAEAIGYGIISISQVISGYRPIAGGSSLLRHNNTELTCHKDINCPEGNNFQIEKNAIACIVMAGGSCTGTLINTSADDNRPVFLTADHCFPASANGSQWIFDWNYEATACGGIGNPGANKFTIGADILARNADTDFALLNLTENPVANRDITIYFLGWDRTTTPATSGVTIHHPKGAQKKISITNVITNVTTTECWNPACTIISPANTLWRVSFTKGSTEKGSSGAPLLNQNKRVVGQLRGGTGICPPNANAISYYGRFDKSWTGGGTNSTRLSNWLDPKGTNATFVNGSPCQTNTNFTNETVNANKTVANCGTINVQNVTVTNNAALELDGLGSVKITSSFKVGLGSKLKIK